MVLMGKFITLKMYSGEKKSLINNLSVHLQKLENAEQNTPKTRNDRVEINEI